MKTKPIRSDFDHRGGGGDPASFVVHAIVIGGGAAGMFAAIRLAQHGIRVTLLEQNERLGKKLAITGKGRCNFTNMAAREDFLAQLVSNSKFFYSAFARLGPQDLRDLFSSYGIPSKEERGKRVFPLSDSAREVVGALTETLRKAGVQIKLKTKVKELLVEDGCAVGVSCLCEGREERLYADYMLLATGGLSYPSTGAGGDGLRMAEAVGHTIVDCYPSLVPFVCAEAYCAELAGLAPRNVTLTIRRGQKLLYQDFGEMLFTHFGVSGPLVLSASAVLTKTLATDSLHAEINWKPYLEESKLKEELLSLLQAGRNKRVQNAISPLYPGSLVPVLLRLAEVDPEKPAHAVTKEERLRICALTMHFPLTITGTRGYNEAVITQGGVHVKEIDPKSMESKKSKRLYCIGELLDLDALTGGFNLQIAWSTAEAAAQDIIQKEKEKENEDRD